MLNLPHPSSSDSFLICLCPGRSTAPPSPNGYASMLDARLCCHGSLWLIRARGKLIPCSIFRDNYLHGRRKGKGNGPLLVWLRTGNFRSHFAAFRFSTVCHCVVLQTLESSPYYPVSFTHAL